MSNNFLVRQILKASGSFFVGASIALGTLSPIVLNSSRVLAASAWVGIPNYAARELQTLDNQGIKPKTIAFTPDGEWVILYNKNGAAWSTNFPPNAVNEILALNKQGSTINNIAFTPNGEWVIIYDGNGIINSDNFPQAALDELAALNKQGATISSVAFTNNGGFAIIFGRNGSYYYKIPQNAINELVSLSK